jgi:hypothetical protein
MRNRILLASCAALFVLCGVLLGMALVTYGQQTYFLSLRSPAWFVFSFFPLSGAFLCLFFFKPEKNYAGDIARFDRFMIETRRAMRGHLKMSILFWILAYRKEKVKSFDEAKREIIHEVRKEIPQDIWLDELLREIQDQLARYK